MEKGLKTLRSHGRSATRKQKGGNQGDDDDNMNDADFDDSGLGPDLNPGDDNSKVAQNNYPGVGHHDHHHPFSDGVSRAHSMHSGAFSSGGHSSACSYRTASGSSSIMHTPHPQHPQPHLQSSPETLPGIAAILESTPVSRY